MAASPSLQHCQPMESQCPAMLFGICCGRGGSRGIAQRKLQTRTLWKSKSKGLGSDKHSGGELVWGSF